MANVTRTWKISGLRPLHPASLAETAIAENWRADWFGLANSIDCPRGRPWGEANFLVSQKTLDELDLNAAIDLSCDHENGTTEFPGYYVIRTQGVTGEPTSCPHWVTLADRRWILEQTPANVRYNLRNGTGATSYIEATTNSGTAYTWAEIFAALWALLPSVAGSAPTLPITPSSTPENLIWEGTATAWQALNELVTAIGCGLVFDPIAGTFDCVELKETQAGLSDLRTSSRNRLIWSFNPQELNATRYPEKVTATFPLYPDGSGAPFEDKPESQDVSLGENGITGTKVLIRDTMFAFSTNAAARTTRAGEIKDAMLGLLKPAAEPWGEIYSGMLEFQLGAELNRITWVSDGEKGMRTIVKLSEMAFDWPKSQTNGVGKGKMGFIIVSVTTAGASSPYNGLKVATVTIKEPGPGAGEIGDSVEVVDHLGCLFNEDNAALVDRRGTAYWGKALDLSSGASSGDETDYHWCGDGLCCP